MWENNVQVDLQFISPRFVNVQFRVNLETKKKHSLLSLGSKSKGLFPSTALAQELIFKTWGLSGT